MDTLHQYNIIKPSHYDKFACAMSACEDNCCNLNWNIYIDKETYEKYKSVNNSDFREKADKYIGIVEEDKRNDFLYARLVTAKEGFCPFQTKEGLCEIHRDHGEDFLSVTCKSYPRNERRMTDDYLELSVSMSCPEAVRIALFDEKPLEFIADTVTIGKGEKIPAGQMRPTDGVKKTCYLDFAWQMREAAITIMQDRACPVAYRIIIIAMMLSDITELHDKNNTGKIPEVLDYYCSAAYGGQFINGFRDIQDNELLRMKMTTLLYFTIRGESKHPRSSKFTELIDRFDNKNKCIESSFDIEVNSMEFYIFVKDAKLEHWETFLEDYEHIIENYLVNYMFTELFPVRYLENGLDPYHHTFLLAEQYAILQILLCGNYKKEEGFTEQYIVSTFSQLAVINQHSDKALKIAENYRNAGISSPAHLFYLLT